jgi:hypothetical protein
MKSLESVDKFGRLRKYYKLLWSTRNLGIIRMA